MQRVSTVRTGTRCLALAAALASLIYLCLLGLIMVAFVAAAPWIASTFGYVALIAALVGIRWRCIRSGSDRTARAHP